MWNLIKVKELKNAFDGIPELPLHVHHWSYAKKKKDNRMIHHHAAHNS